MPYKHGRRKKRRTHVDPTKGISSEKIPKSFVIKRGKVDKSVKELLTDVRQIMMPHTAAYLKERKSNTLRDFVSVAGPLGISHMLLFSQTDAGNIHLRIGKLAHGPTLTFRVESFSLARQIKAAQKRPVDPANAYGSSPLVVLHNFSNVVEQDRLPNMAGVPLSDALKLTVTTFQNMFPAINPATLKLVDCRRVLLVHYNKEANAIELRHYLIRAAPVGISRGVKKVLSGKTPNLHKMEDVADFLLDNGAGSESEFEDPSSRVVLPQDFIGLGNSRSQQSAIKLTEIGPRIALSLLKIEGGLFSGEVLYHSLEKRTIEQAAELAQKAKEKADLKEERRRIQNENVARKAAEKAQKKADKAARRAEKAKSHTDQDEDGDDEDGLGTKRVRDNDYVNSDDDSEEQEEEEKESEEEVNDEGEGDDMIVDMDDEDEYSDDEDVNVSRANDPNPRLDESESESESDFLSSDEEEKSALLARMQESKKNISKDSVPKTDSSVKGKISLKTSWKK